MAPNDKTKGIEVEPIVKNRAKFVAWIGGSDPTGLRKSVVQVLDTVVRQVLCSIQSNSAPRYEPTLRCLAEVFKLNIGPARGDSPCRLRRQLAEALQPGATGLRHQSRYHACIIARRENRL
jgi:hypothetical protein